MWNSGTITDLKLLDHTKCPSSSSGRISYSPRTYVEGSWNLPCLYRVVIQRSQNFPHTNTRIRTHTQVLVPVKRPCVHFISQSQRRRSRKAYGWGSNDEMKKRGRQNHDSYGNWVDLNGTWVKMDRDVSPSTECSWSSYSRKRDAETNASRSPLGTSIWFLPTYSHSSSISKGTERWIHYWNPVNTGQRFSESRRIAFTETHYDSKIQGHYRRREGENRDSNHCRHENNRVPWRDWDTEGVWRHLTGK